MTIKKSYNEIKESKGGEKIAYMVLLNTLEWQEKREKILERDKSKCNSCGMHSSEIKAPFGLDIHHKYYIVGNLPWEYEDSALETLCRICHNYLHSTTSIPSFIMENGELVMFNGRLCHRCNGFGYIPRHKNIENGICFRCRGRRFEELIYFIQP